MKTLWVETRTGRDHSAVTVTGKADSTWGKMDLMFYQLNQNNKMKNKNQIFSPCPSFRTQVHSWFFCFSPHSGLLKIEILNLFPLNTSPWFSRYTNSCISGLLSSTGQWPFCLLLRLFSYLVIYPFILIFTSLWILGGSCIFCLQKVCEGLC